MRVLFRGGRREADPPAVVDEAAGDGVEGDISRSALTERMAALSRPSLQMSIGVIMLSECNVRRSDGVLAGTMVRATVLRNRGIDRAK